jgi:predicted nucleic acid-binding protein
MVASQQIRLTAHREVKCQAYLWVLMSALNAKADVLITGDKVLLDIIKQVQEVRILNPRQFWELERQRAS